MSVRDDRVKSGKAFWILFVYVCVWRGSWGVNLAAGYPIILTIVSSWVRRLTIVGFLDSKTKGN